jgi:hypothetical protein
MQERLSENHNFDFDIGYLVKSPCRDCLNRDDLPNCIQGCEILDKIQTVLADSIPSETNFGANLSSQTLTNFGSIPDLNTARSGKFVFS